MYDISYYTSTWIFFSVSLGKHTNIPLHWSLKDEDGQLGHGETMSAVHYTLSSLSLLLLITKQRACSMQIWQKQNMFTISLSHVLWFQCGLVESSFFPFELNGTLLSEKVINSLFWKKKNLTRWKISMSLTCPLGICHIFPLWHFLWLCPRVCHKGNISHIPSLQVNNHNLVTKQNKRTFQCYKITLLLFQSNQLHVHVFWLRKALNTILLFFKVLSNSTVLQ